MLTYRVTIFFKHDANCRDTEYHTHMKVFACNDYVMNNGVVRLVSYAEQYKKISSKIFNMFDIESIDTETL